MQRDDMPPISRDVAQGLVDRMREAGVPVNALAEVLGVERRTLGNWLSGRRDMPETMAAVVEAVLAFRARANPTP